MIKFILSTVMIIITSAMIYANHNIDIEQIIILVDKHKISEKLINNAQGTLIYEYICPDSTIMSNWVKDALTDMNYREVYYTKDTINLVYDNNNIYCKVNSYDNSIPRETWLYDGEKTKCLKYQETENGIILPSGSIDNNNTIYLDKYDPRFRMNSIVGIPIYQILKNIINKSETDMKYGNIQKFEIFEDKEDENKVYQIVKFELIDEHQTNEITVWFASDIDYHIEKYELISPNYEIIGSLEYQKYKDNIWFPKYILLEKYDIDNDTQEKVHSIRKWFINNDWEFNTVLSDDIFELTFPKGLFVRDRRMGKTYTVE